MRMEFVNMPQVRAAVDRLHDSVDDIRKAIAAALTDSAFNARNVNVRTLPQVFDRPTRFTLNALFVKAAEKVDSPMFSLVWFKSPRRGNGAHYLEPSVHGGKRPLKTMEKRFLQAGFMQAGEIAVPGKNVQLDAHGNLPNGYINKMLSALRMQSDPQQNRTTKSARRKTSFFVGGMKGSRARMLPRGVYERSHDGSLVLVLAFVQQRKGYEIRYKFFDITKQAHQQFFPAALRKRIDAAVTKAGGKP